MTPWNSARACLYGSAIGAVAAAFKLLAPINTTGSALASKPHTPLAIAEEIAGAALAFALLCGLAAALRNFIARRAIGPESP
jgi:hypothetical protein